jgi:putative ABC transport system substrate-binding protein
MIGVLVDPKFPMSDAQVQEIRNASAVLALQVRIAHAGTENEMDNAIAELVKNGAGALLLAGGPFFNNNRTRLVALTAHHRPPAIAGDGLMSYAPRCLAYIGIYSGRILQGEKPSDLPFLQPSKLDFAFNVKTAPIDVQIHIRAAKYPCANANAERRH